MNFEVLTTGGEPDKVSASAWEPSASAFPVARCGLLAWTSVQGSPSRRPGERR